MSSKVLNVFIKFGLSRMNNNKLLSKALLNNNLLFWNLRMFYFVHQQRFPFKTYRSIQSNDNFMTPNLSSFLFWKSNVIKIFNFVPNDVVGVWYIIIRGFANDVLQKYNLISRRICWCRSGWIQVLCWIYNETTCIGTAQWNNFFLIFKFSLTMTCVLSTNTIKTARFSKS